MEEADEGFGAVLDRYARVLKVHHDRFGALENLEQAIRLAKNAKSRQKIAPSNLQDC